MHLSRIVGLWKYGIFFSIVEIYLIVLLFVYVVWKFSPLRLRYGVHPWYKSLMARVYVVPSISY